MQKQRIIYDSRVDALVALAKRLSHYEEGDRLSSEDFFDRYDKGLLEDTTEFTEWSSDYRNFLTLRSELGNLLSHAA